MFCVEGYALDSLYVVPGDCLAMCERLQEVTQLGKLSLEATYQVIKRTNYCTNDADTIVQRHL